VKTLLIRHVQNAVGAIGHLSRQPLATALTTAVIGIALALPAGLQVLVQSGQTFAGNWRDIRDFSVYLKPGTALSAARELAGSLEQRPDIARTRVIAADDALAEFREDPTFGQAVTVLTSNPLPHTLVVRPTADASPARLARLKDELEARSEVDLVQLDTQWLSRLAAILDVLRRAVWIAAVLLVAAVILIVGNTIRLDIQNRRQEIEVSKLLGASDAFVRRPFLYTGLWYGVIGSLVALAVLGTGLLLLNGPLERLLRLYGAEFAGVAFPALTGALVVGGGVLAGWLGAWTAVARHLSAIEPRV
jgi:cell division transport system permease protein